MPGHTYAAQQLGVSERTIGSLIAEQRLWGCIGLVAGGQSAAVTGRADNDRAVYVLCMPEDVASTHNVQAPVDKIFHPIVFLRESVKSLIPKTVQRHRPLSSWDPTRTTGAKTKRETNANVREATLLLQERVFVLRNEPTGSVARVLRRFFDAGELVGDIQHMIDHKPDGTRHPHSGFDGARSPVAVLASRLWRHWLDADGVPIPSPRRRRQAEREPQRRHASETTRRHEQGRLRRGADEPGFAGGIALLRSVTGKRLSVGIPT